jgi:hydrogenase maturation factor
MIGFEGETCRYDDVGRCITCGDEALEAEVLRVDEAGTALVTVGGQMIEIDVSLIDALSRGDRVLIHGGVALARL